MSAPEQVRHLEEISRDLDLLVFRLERPVAPTKEELRRELERLRDRVVDVVRALDR